MMNQYTNFYNDMEQRLRLHHHDDDDHDHDDFIIRMMKRTTTATTTLIDDDVNKKYHCNTNDDDNIQRPYINILPSSSSLSSSFQQQHQQRQDVESVWTTIIVSPKQQQDISNQIQHIMYSIEQQLSILEQNQSNHQLVSKAILRTCTECADTIAHFIRNIMNHSYQYDENDYDNNYNNDIRPNNNNNNNIVDSSTKALEEEEDDDDDDISKVLFTRNHSLRLQVTEQQQQHNTNDTMMFEEEGLYYQHIHIPDTDNDNIDDGLVVDVNSSNNIIDNNINNNNSTIDNNNHMIIDLLVDVETTLRNITIDDANDIADATLVLGRIMYTVLQQIIQKNALTLLTVSSDDDNDNYNYNNNNSNNMEQESFNRIELLDNDDDIINHKRLSNQEQTVLLSSSSSRNNYHNNNNYNQIHNNNKLRTIKCIFWPPLQPIALNIVECTKEEIFMKQPWYISTGIVLCSWPMITTTIIFGGTIVITDTILQNIYQQIQNHPFIIMTEITLSSLYQTMKLCYLSSKIMIIKPSIRIIQKQYHRYIQIINNNINNNNNNNNNSNTTTVPSSSIPELVQYHITHPIQTIHTIWDTCMTCSHFMYGFCSDRIHEWYNDIQQQHQLHPTNHNNDYNDDVLSVPPIVIETDDTYL